MNWKDYPYGLHRPDPSPNPVSKNAQTESFLQGEDAARVSKDPWYPPDWMMPAIRCPFCNGRTSYSRQATCRFCGLVLSKDCLVLTPICEECSSPWPYEQPGPGGRGWCCPNCYRQGLCPCGHRVSEDDVLPPPDEPLRTNEEARDYAEEMREKERRQRTELQKRARAKRIAAERERKACAFDRELAWRQEEEAKVPTFWGWLNQDDEEV